MFYTSKEILRDNIYCSYCNQYNLKLADRKIVTVTVYKRMNNRQRYCNPIFAICIYYFEYETFSIILHVNIQIKRITENKMVYVAALQNT